MVRNPRSVLALRVGALALTAALVGTACGETNARPVVKVDVAADSDYVGPPLADFRMTDSDGREVTLDSLAGAPFVLDFVFTTCSGPCPRMSEGMAELQGALADTPVRLVSVSVDPETDTLEVLSTYAEAHAADPERWTFLRGEEAQVEALAASVSVAMQRNPGADLGLQVAHSTRYMVVDGQGRVRGYYEGTTPEGRAAAAARARWLARR
ncbi:MAG TPA: SCO family protein [Planctomycetota bacterium]|nr:SCO family protein [Planctomycetota bacterium]